VAADVGRNAERGRVGGDVPPVVDAVEPDQLGHGAGMPMG
jgi:hypothetical protein